MMNEMVSKKGKKVFTIKSGGQHRLTIVPYSCNQSNMYRYVECTVLNSHFLQRLSRPK